MMHVVSSEARVHPRLRLNVRADVIGREVVLARPVEDISLGGCRFGGPAWEQAGDRVDMLLEFPSSGATVPLRAEIVRAGAEDMGVRFCEVTDEQKWALRKHIRQAQR